MKLFHFWKTELLLFYFISSTLMQLLENPNLWKHAPETWLRKILLKLLWTDFAFEQLWEWLMKKAERRLVLFKNCSSDEKNEVWFKTGKVIVKGWEDISYPIYNKLGYLVLRLTYRFLVYTLVAIILNNNFPCEIRILHENPFWFSTIPPDMTLQVTSLVNSHGNLKGTFFLLDNGMECL